jgi:hypothetical protein
MYIYIYCQVLNLGEVVVQLMKPEDGGWRATRQARRCARIETALEGEGRPRQKQPSTLRCPILTSSDPNTKFRAAGAPPKEIHPDRRMDPRGSPIIASFVPFLFLLLVVVFSSVIPASAGGAGGGGGNGNGTAVPFRSAEELLRFQRIKAQLARTRDASVKTIQACIHSFLAVVVVLQLQR